MSNTFNLEVVTPGGKVFAGQAEELIAPGTLGEFGILPGHISFLSSLDAGPMIVSDGSSKDYYVVYGGFCEVRADKVVVLADRVEKASDLSQSEAEEALGDANARLAEAGSDKDAYEKALREVGDARARLITLARMNAH
ncbi:MAG: ATP synthase F1 subunit epsilon [Chrysiogenetes bacterium]|nr:ATP synthase F1 subunit epsilon [Chrysiogenetes bacterium]